MINPSRRLFHGIVVVLCSLLFASCVTQPVLSREEWLSMTNRTYEGVTKEQAISAAERLLRLADGNDFMIAHHDDGFSATRNWTVYLVLSGAAGTDSWSIRAVENGNAETRISVNVSTQVAGMGAVATGPNSVAPVTSPAMVGAVNGTAIYDVFWARMDYLLGRRKIWMTCTVANQRVSDGLVWGDNSALCNGFNVKDDVPQGAPIREDMTPEQERKWKEDLTRQNSY